MSVIQGDSQSQSIIVPDVAYLKRHARICDDDSVVFNDCIRELPDGHTLPRVPADIAARAELRKSVRKKRR